MKATPISAQNGQFTELNNSSNRRIVRGNAFVLPPRVNLWSDFEERALLSDRTCVINGQVVEPFSPEAKRVIEKVVAAFDRGIAFSEPTVALMRAHKSSLARGQGK